MIAAPAARQDAPLPARIAAAGFGPTAAIVWRACDGHRTITDLVMVTGLPAETIREVLALLDTAGLVTAHIGLPRQSRRSLLRTAGIAGAVAVPAIVSVSAPLAARAQSSCVGFESCDAAHQGVGCCHIAGNTLWTCGWDPSAQEWGCFVTDLCGLFFECQAGIVRLRVKPIRQECRRAMRRPPLPL